MKPIHSIKSMKNIQEENALKETRVKSHLTPNKTYQDHQSSC